MLGSPIWWRWHQSWDEWLVIFLSFEGVLPLLIDLLLHELQELAFRDIFEISCITSALPHEPLENFLKGILPTLLISNVVAKCGLLVELSNGISCLFKANLQTIQVYISTTCLGMLLLLHGLLRPLEIRRLLISLLCIERICILGLHLIVVEALRVWGRIFHIRSLNGSLVWNYIN